MCPVAYRSRRQITFSGTVKNPFGRGAHEGRLLSLLRRSGQAQRQELIGVPAVEVHGLRRVDGGEVRRHRGGARGVPRAAPLEGLAVHDAGRRAVLQAQDGRVLGGLAHARVRRRGPQGRLRRRHIPRQGPRRPHRAVAEVWPQTMVQRCLWHAFSQVNRHMTSRPRLRAGMLRGLDGVGA